MLNEERRYLDDEILLTLERTEEDLNDAHGELKTQTALVKELLRALRAVTSTNIQVEDILRARALIERIEGGR